MLTALVVAGGGGGGRRSAGGGAVLDGLRSTVTAQLVVAVL
jgi:hypothetical protein